jgi:ABC-type multidrug transport system ATPase subunit
LKKIVGYCPQEDIHFEDLTVEEHLEMICEIKNIPFEEVQEAIDLALDKLMLQDDRKKLTQHLSGGTKRKLSLAIAVIAKPKLIILDEPTSGLDVESREQVKDMIKKLKKDKTIIYAT